MRCFAIVTLTALLGSLGFGGAARAQQASPPPPAVAVLPLDADERLEIYGQAVATELARALNADGIEVLVAGPNADLTGMPVIVSGKIAQDKGARGPITLELSVRSGATILEKLSASAPTLAQIDRAATELADRVVPIVRERLRAPAAERAPLRPPDVQRRPAPVTLVGVTAKKPPRLAPLRTALAAATDPWVRAARREPRSLDPKQEPPKAAAVARAERAVALEVLDYEIARERDVPLARARVRVRISDDYAVRFDRIVRTDTVVGARGMRDDALAALVAQEVLAILRPHMRKLSGWP